MKLLARYFPLLLITFIPCISQLCQAYEPGSVIVRAGAAYVDPDDSSEELRLRTDTQDLVIPGSGVDVDNATSLGITAVYMFHDNWGVELLAAWPFTHDLDLEVEGVTAGPVSLGDTRQLPPTLSIQWYPLNNNCLVQPYVGFGVNYTHFYDEDIEDDVDAAFRDLGATGGSDLSLDSSWGIAGEIGVDFTFGERSPWLFNLSVWYLDIDTEADIDIPGVGRINVDVDVDPFVYMVGFGYRF